MRWRWAAGSCCRLCRAAWALASRRIGWREQFASMGAMGTIASVDLRITTRISLRRTRQLPVGPESKGTIDAASEALRRELRKRGDCGGSTV